MRDARSPDLKNAIFAASGGQEPWLTPARVADVMERITLNMDLPTVVDRPGIAIESAGER